WANGYHGTSVMDILTGAGLPKGSFYFYFSGKKELAMATAAYYEDKILSWIKKLARNAEMDAFIVEMTNGLLDSAKKGRIYGCPFVFIASEMAFADPDVTELFAASLEKFIDVFEAVLLYSGISASAANALARRFFAIYEGHLLLYRIAGGPKEIERMRENMLELYQTSKEMKSDAVI
ncbi:MAG: TetR/AcrR family transcriptional regulator, partial [Peptococcaceae bacterium]|nr:TetR/AcrR family transcriptional regulator [Peptococcaceae bacterium]